MSVAGDGDLALAAVIRGTRICPCRRDGQSAGHENMIRDPGSEVVDVGLCVGRLARLALRCQDRQALG